MAGQAAAAPADTKAAIDALVAARMAAGGPPGLALVISVDGGPAEWHGYGSAELEQETPVSADSVFPIASITKTFTALAIMQLAQDGRLRIADPLSRFMPDFPNAERITLRDLLVHTSGIAEFTRLAPFLADQARDWTPDELVAMVAGTPPLGAPGETCEYSDSAYILLGKVIEKAGGEPYAAFVRQRVALPLAMPSVAMGSHTTLLPWRVAGYARRGEGWTNASYISLTAPWAAGGLWALPRELVRLAAALRPDGPLLTPASYAAMIAPVILADAMPCTLPLPGAEATYGYGLEIVRFDDLPNHRAIGKSGVFPGYSSYFAVFENSGFAIAALANADGSLPFTVQTVHDVAKLLLDGS